MLYINRGSHGPAGIAKTDAVAHEGHRRIDVVDDLAKLVNPPPRLLNPPGGVGTPERIIPVLS